MTGEMDFVSILLCQVLKSLTMKSEWFDVHYFSYYISFICQAKGKPNQVPVAKEEMQKKAKDLGKQVILTLFLYYGVTEMSSCAQGTRWPLIT